MLSTTYVLGDSMIKYIDNDHADVKVYCVPGATIQDMTQIISKHELLSKTNVALIFHVGTNNLCTNSVSVTSAISKVKQLLTYIEDHNTSARVAFSSVFNRTLSDFNDFDECEEYGDDHFVKLCGYNEAEIELVNSNIDSFNSQLQLLCSVSNVGFIDNSSINHPNFIGRDGLHLNRKGSRALSRSLHMAVERTAGSYSERANFSFQSHLSQFPSLPAREESLEFHTSILDSNLRCPSLSRQTKYSQKQSVGESNGIKQKMSELEQNRRNERKHRRVYKKPLIKNKSHSRYTPSQSEDYSQCQVISSDRIKIMNRFCLLQAESDLNESNETQNEDQLTGVVIDPTFQEKSVKVKAKRSHQMKQKSKVKAKSKNAKKKELFVEKMHEDEDLLTSSLGVADRPFQVTIDISVVSSDCDKTVVYTDNIEKVPMSAVYNFVSDKTGVSSRNLYFRKVSGQYIDKQSWLTRDIEHIVMYFKLDGGVRGRKRKGDSHHPGKECGPCVVCGKSENRYFHLIDRQEQESLLQHFQKLLPGINLTDCICRTCETSFKNQNYMSVKRSRKDLKKGSKSICDMSAYGICKMQKERSVLVNKKELFDTFGIPIDCSSDTEVTVSLCSQHHLKFFNRSCKHKCLICLKQFVSAEKQYYFTESTLEFARLYMQNIPCSDVDTDRYLSKNGPVCRGCKYSVEKYMNDNFKPEGGDINYSLQIQNVKDLWSASTEAKPGLSKCIIACCDAFIDHKPVLLAEMHKVFLDSASDDEKVNANQRWLLQKMLEIFQCTVTIITDDYKRMGTMLKRSDNNDNKILHTYIYDSFTSSMSSEMKAHDSDVPKHNTLEVSSKLLREKLVAMKEKISLSTLDIENFDPWKFIEENCDPLLFNFISSLQGETISSFIDKLDIGMLKKNKALACLNMISCLLFSSDLSCQVPLPMLISDIIDKYTNSSSECLRILNQFGMCYSKPTLNRYQNSVIERKSEIGAQISLESFTVCSVDNINKRSSYASVKASDTSRGFDGTSVQLVEPKPLSCKWSNEEVNQELAGCISLIDMEGIKYKKLKVNSDLSLFRSLNAICLSHIRHSKRNESGAYLCPEIETEDNKISNILSNHVTKLLQSLGECEVEKSEHNLYYAISYLTNIPIQVFEKSESEPGKIEIVFQSNYLQMGRESSSFVLNIFKESSSCGTYYNPIFTTRSYFNENLLSSDFFTCLEKNDIEMEKVAFKLFFMSASSFSSTSASKTKGKTKSSIMQENLVSEFSSLNLNLNIPVRRNLSSNSSVNNFSFETVFSESDEEIVTLAQ